MTDLRRFAASPLLRAWVAPRYLEPATIRRIQHDIRSRPYAKYGVLDDFFDPARFADMARRHRRLGFRATDLASPFDSFLVGARPGRHVGTELFFSRIWQDLIATLSGVPVRDYAATKVMLRRHRRRANGFWPHTDRNKAAETTSGVFIYLNRDWRVEDGGLLQFWRTVARARRRRGAADRPVRWSGKKGVRLEFLGRKEIFVEVGTYANRLAAMQFSLLEQIVPAYNRVVVCDFVSDPAYHSVSPGQDRLRYDVTQRLF